MCGWCVVLLGYGMTECMPISSPPQTYALNPSGTSGIPCGPTVIIVDPDHKGSLPPGSSGECLVQ
jgi:long-subunit acyl-CoA synthetase (AMP-forming)